MKIIFVIILLLALCLTPMSGFAFESAAQANVNPAPAIITPAAVEPAPPGDSQVVMVAGVGNIDWKPYKIMVKGIDAYHANRTLAPQAPLRFLMRPLSDKAILEGLGMSLIGKTTSIEIPVAADGSFSLPHDESALQDDAELILNRKKGMFGWMPDIRSPNVPANARRLGDLRLECEVQWAVEKSGVSFVLRGALSLAGGPCQSSKLRPMRPMYGKLQRLTLVDGERRQDLAYRVNGNVSMYFPPFADKAWPDDTLIEFEFQR